MASTFKNGDQPQHTPSIRKPLPKEVRNLLAGGIAGMVAKSVVAPLDRIKILYQVSSQPFTLRGLPTFGRRLVAEEGLQALWKGNSATMIRVFPYSGVQFMVFDRCKAFFLERSRQQRHTTTTTTRRMEGLTALESLIGGAVAGTISVICTYPLDLTRAQLAVMKKGHRKVNFVEVIAQNYSEKGIPGLFRGIVPTLLGILPYAGTAFALNEQAKRYITHVSGGHEPTTIQKMECGAVSGLIAQTLTYPLEVTRRRMQTIAILNKGDGALNLKAGSSASSAAASRTTKAVEVSMMNTIRSLYKQEGMAGFFKGVTMNWMKGPVAFSISFTTFDIIKSQMETEEERRSRMR